MYSDRYKLKPACFTDEQWRTWYENCAHLVNAVDFACTDCTPQYKERMMKAGKCDWPCVQFFPVKEVKKEEGDESHGVMKCDDVSVLGRRMSVTQGRGYGHPVPDALKSK